MLNMATNICVRTSVGMAAGKDKDTLLLTYELYIAMGSIITTRDPDIHSMAARKDKGRFEDT